MIKYYERVNWEEAACRFTDTDSFYPEGAGEALAQNRVLRRICQECPIVNACANYAVVHEKHGYWGGLSPRDRWDIRKRNNVPEPIDDDFIGMDCRT